MPPDREDLHDELLAMLAASREMPPEDEEYLVEPFLDRLEEEHGTRLRRRSPGHLYRRRPALSYVSLTTRASALIFVLAGIMFLVSLAAGTPVALLALIAIAACLFSIPSGLKAGLDYGLERRLTRLENIWASEGNGPPLVVRTYTTDTLFERDAARLMQLGYTIQSQHRVFGGNRVTYTLETRR